MAEWISVKERLPKESDRIWNPYSGYVYKEAELDLIKKEIIVLAFSASSNWYEIKIFFIEDPDPNLNLNRGPGFYDCPDPDWCSWEKDDTITHWMPLPEPPEEV